MTYPIKYTKQFPEPMPGTFRMIAGDNAAPVICDMPAPNELLMDYRNSGRREATYTEVRKVILGTFRVDRTGPENNNTPEARARANFEFETKPEYFEMTGGKREYTNDQEIDHITQEHLNETECRFATNDNGSIATQCVIVTTEDGREYVTVFQVEKNRPATETAIEIIRRIFTGKLTITTQTLFAYNTIAEDNGRHLPIIYTNTF